MGVLVALAGQWLALLHDAVGIPLCPGDWVWTVTVAGVVLAMSPVLAMALVALARRSLGNRYSLGAVLTFAVLGVAGTAVVPLLGFSATSAVLTRVAAGRAVPGLSAGQGAGLQDSYCFLPAQAGYLGGGGRTVADALSALPGPDWLLGGRAMLLLVATPVLALVFTWILARLALRRGPAWPGWLLWAPFLLLVLGTLPLDEGVVSQLWVGYLMGTIPGMVLLVMIGRPRWKVINRKAAEPPPEPDRHPPASPAPGAAPPVAAPPVAAPPVAAPPVAPPPVAAPPVAAPPAAAPPVPGAAPHPLPPTRALPDLALPQPLSPTRQETGSAAAPGTGDGGHAPLAADPGPLPAALAAAAGAAAGAGAGAAGGAGDGAGGPRFRRMRRLGEGGFGDVWLARDTVLGREVAIKVARAPDPDTEHRIRREARALAAVHHPHCVRVYDILDGLDDLPGLAIVMEYVPGPSLGLQVRQQGPLSDTAGAHLWLTLAGALDAAHQRRVLHRDVKPSNIIIDPTGQAHLIDFGIARAEGDPAMTATGIVIGTPEFLAPEVAAGTAADLRADSWQLAATISYALCGRPPRGEHDSVADALRAAAERAPLVALAGHSAHVHLLAAAMHPDPGRRPTLAQVQAELATWLAKTGRPMQGPVTRTLAIPHHT